MKAIKLVLVIAILGIAGLSYADVDPGPRTFKVTLQKAMESRGLVRAIYQQVDQSFLQVDQNGYYVARVVYNHSIYVIYGKYEEWVRFFSMDLDGELVRSSLNNNQMAKPVK
jgi:hypothetical protein